MISFRPVYAGIDLTRTKVVASRQALKGYFKQIKTQGRTMGVNQSLLDEIVCRILKIMRPRRIILFGSAAVNQMTADSDIDLLILKDEQPRDRSEWLLAMQALRDLEYPVDLVVMALETFEESKNIVGGIAYPAGKHGRVLYEAA